MEKNCRKITVFLTTYWKKRVTIFMKYITPHVNFPQYPCVVRLQTHNTWLDPEQQFYWWIIRRKSIKHLNLDKKGVLCANRTIYTLYGSRLPSYCTKRHYFHYLYNSFFCMKLKFNIVYYNLSVAVKTLVKSCPG